MISAQKPGFSYCFKINTKILERNPVSQPRDNLNLYYDATPLFVAIIFVFHIT